MLSLLWPYRYRGNLEYDTILVCAMRSTHRISTYKLLAISESLYRARKQIHPGKKRISKYDRKGKEGEQRKESQRDISKDLQKCGKNTAIIMNAIYCILFHGSVSTDVLSDGIFALSFNLFLTLLRM